MDGARVARGAVAGVWLLFELATGSWLFGQINQKTLDRNFEPVVMTGSNFSQFSTVPLDELFLYAFDVQREAWSQIPYQIDERDATGDYFAVDDIPGLDDNDELVFMARDAGDRAVASWIPDQNSISFVRYEIEVVDPLTGNKGWVYLYRSQALKPDPNVTSYMTYVASSGANVGEDTVRTSFYELANLKNGFPSDLSITPAGGGTGQDLLDVLKFQANTSIADINENDITADVVDVRAGQVRVLRRLFGKLKVNLPFPLPDINVDFNTPPAIYYPFSLSIDVDVPDLPVSVSSARMSIDLNANATGMQFVSANNPQPGFIIDGKVDSPNSAIDDLLPDNNWIVITGTPGTIVHFFPLAPTVGGQRQLYYRDDSSQDNKDTGDKKSFGDTGILLTNDVASPFRLSYQGYFLAGDQSTDIGTQLAQFDQNPLQVQSTAQDFGTVPVELVSFTAAADGNDVKLAWVTATETDNFGFDIERRGESEATWKKVGFVAGKGTTANPSRYSFVDRALPPGKYDYRLKQIDFDGTYEYTNAIEVT
ncbi:MAG: hypothetical protein D6743_14740, partial [Calditrichaeota bacterium]